MEFKRISQKQYEADALDSGLSCVEYDNIRLPHRATKYSAGYDFYATTDICLQPRQTIKIPSGISVELDNDKFLMIVPRSSLGFKYRLQLDNTVGIIDADYIHTKNEGHIWFKLTNESNNSTLHILPGEAMAQGIILQYYTITNDDSNAERKGGIGSTSATGGEYV